MNKYIFPTILILIAGGIYFTFTQGQIEKLSSLRATNAAYEKAVENATELVKRRDQVIAAYNSISPDNIDRLDKILPEEVDIVRLIIDVRTLFGRRGVTINAIQTEHDSTVVKKENTARPNLSADVVADAPLETDNTADAVEPVAVSFEFVTTYPVFVQLLKDMESSLRVVDVSKVEMEPDEDQNKIKFTLELRTYWIRQK